MYIGRAYGQDSQFSTPVCQAQANRPILFAVTLILMVVVVGMQQGAKQCALNEGK